ncbi:UBA/TS-N domain protein, partial [Paragonimus heterotremus]
RQLRGRFGWYWFCVSLFVPRVTHWECNCLFSFARSDPLYILYINLMDKSMRGKTRDFVDLDNGSCLAKMPAATAEQLNIAKILSKPGDNIDISYYVAQLQELTSCTEDQAVTALYDCENNLERAVELVLDKFRCGTDDEWHTTGRKSRVKHTSANESEHTLHSSPQEENAENCRFRKTKSVGSARSELPAQSSSPCPAAELPKSGDLDFRSKRGDQRNRRSQTGKSTGLVDEVGRKVETSFSKSTSRAPVADAAGRDYKTRSKVSEFDGWDPYTEYGEWGGEAIEVVNSNAYIPREIPEEETLRDELFVDIENNSTQEPPYTETIHPVDKTVQKPIKEGDSSDSLFVSKVFSKQPPPAFANLPNDVVFVVPDLFSRNSRWSAKFGGELCVQGKLPAARTAVNATPSKEPTCNQTSQNSLPNLSKDQVSDPQIYSSYVPSPPSKPSDSGFDMNKPGSARSLLETPTPSDKKTDLIPSSYPANHFQNASATPNVSTFPVSQKPQPSVAFNSENGGGQSGYLESSLKNYLLESLPKEMNKLSVGDVPQNPKTSQFNMQSVQQSQQTLNPPFSHTQGNTTATLQHQLGKVPMSHISSHGSLHSTQQPIVSGASHQPQTAALPPGMPHFISQFAPPAYHMFNLPGSSGNQPTIFELDQLQFLQQQQRLLYDMHLQQQSSTTAQSLTSSAEAASAGKPASHSIPGTLGHVTAANAGIRPDLLASAMGHAPQMLPPGHPYFSYPGFVVMVCFHNCFVLRHCLALLFYYSDFLYQYRLPRSMVFLRSNGLFVTGEVACSAH